MWHSTPDREHHVLSPQVSLDDPFLLHYVMIPENSKKLAYLILRDRSSPPKRLLGLHIAIYLDDPPDLILIDEPELGLLPMVIFVHVDLVQPDRHLAVYRHLTVYRLSQQIL